MSVGLKHTNFDSNSQMNSMQMTCNRQNDTHHVLFGIFHHGQPLRFTDDGKGQQNFHRRGTQTTSSQKLLTKSTHSFLPGNLSGATSLSKTLNQDFSHSIVRIRHGKTEFSQEKQSFAIFRPTERCLFGSKFAHWFGHNFDWICTCFVPLTHECWLAHTVSVNHQ